MRIDIWRYESRGQWCADVPVENGRKRLYLGDNEAKARAALRRHMASYYDNLDADAGDNRPILKRSGSSVSLVELAVRFVQWNKVNRSSGTWRTYRDGLKRFVPDNREKLCTEVVPSDVEDVKAKLIESGCAPRTINIMVAAVKRLYSWAVEQGLMAESPVARVANVSKHVNAPDHPEPRHLAIEKALKGIQLCRGSQPLGDICELLLLTGMRVGEVCHLCWGDVDLGQRMLRLERHKTSSRGGGRPRTIPLCDRAIEIIARQAPDDPKPDRPVFVGRDRQQFTVDILHCRLRRLRRKHCKKHPELKRFSFHKLRHTTATYLARLKVPERVAQAILGHSSTLMTRYYTATDPDEMIAAVETLSRQAAGAGPT